MPSAPITLQQLSITCEALYQRDGFVRWADVAKTHGLTRQAVQSRLRKATERGDIDEATFKRWQSMSARRTETAKRAKEKDQLESTLRVSVVLSPENVTWLKDQCTERGCTRADILNGLINKARTGR